MNSNGIKHLNIINSFFEKAHPASTQATFYTWLLNEKEKACKKQAMKEKFESYNATYCKIETDSQETDKMFQNIIKSNNGAFASTHETLQQ
jgi:hypothetical protein